MGVHRVVVVAVAALIAAGCGTQHLVGGSAPHRVGTSHGPASPASNKKATEHEATRLLGLTPLPPGATPTDERPSVLSGPALGTPATDSLVDPHEYWHVDMTMDQAYAWVKAHRPHGLSPSGSGSSGGPTGATSEGIAWAERDTAYAEQLNLEVAVAPAAHGGAVIRGDGMGEWLDPRPVRDSLHGRRLRVTVAAGCPGSDSRIVGVRNPDASGLTDALVPSGDPTGGLLCLYNGMNNRPASGLHRSIQLTAQRASALGRELRAVKIPHLDGGATSCPMDDGTASVIVLSYAGRADVDVFFAMTGCGGLSNGHIVVDEARISLHAS